MRHQQLNAASRLLFKGWDDVITYTTDTLGGVQHVVQLRVSDIRVQAAVVDRERFLSELFSRASLDELAKRIVSNRRTKGLRRYGRKR